MGCYAMMDHGEQGHLTGDVAALWLTVILLGWLTPRGFAAQAGEI